MDVDAYLARIGATRPVAPTADALAVLHRAHVLSVPFEDLDIHLGVPISLNLADLHDKIVRRGRGGFCYELNGLFAELLAELGYPVRLVSAFTLAADGSRGAEFDHMRLLVEQQEQTWLADVGNGASRLDPVPLRPGEHGEVRVHRDGDLWWTARRSSGGEWEPEWAWTPVARTLGDFTARCRHQEHDPESHFRARRMAVLPTTRGRLSLVNGMLTEIVDGRRTDREVPAEQETALLAERFGLVISGDWVSAAGRPR